MYELDRQGATADDCAQVPGEAYSYVRDIAAAAFLFWGEHCVECAMPSCFETCDLYQPRPDGRCRRFTRGIARNSAYPSARGYGAEVAFKKWGKLETRGNTALMSHRSLLRLERLLGEFAPLLDRFGSAASRIVGDPRWRWVTLRALETLGRKLHPLARRGLPPDALLLEIYNPGSRLEVLHVSMTVARKELSRALDPTALLPSFRQRIELPPGYSRHDIEYTEFAAVTECGLPFDVALIPEADTDPTLIFLSADFVRFTQQPAPKPKLQTDQPPVKCVVWDLDNTMWKGILLEDEGVYPDTAATELMRTLDQRGILFSVASKNDFNLAMQKMKEIGIEEYMLFPQIGWSPKSAGIRAIAEKLNIGLDSFMFIDDNPFELDEVARALPMVTCVNARDLRKLAGDPRLQGSTTAEARRRRTMYREAMTREYEERKFDDDFFGFLRSCNMKLRIIPYRAEYFERVCELLQRTNQLNFSGRKYPREEIGPILAERLLEKWVLECSDKFGSCGVVGFSLVSRRSNEVRVEDFMLSCRVQGRFVEQAFFDTLVGDDRGVDRISVNFTATGRNTPAQQVLSTIGFEEMPEGIGMALDLRKRRLDCDFIEVECETATQDRPMAAAAGI
jgi:FkbH-like protein